MDGLASIDPGTRRTSPRTVWLTALALTACGPAVGTDGDGSGGGSSTADASTTSTANTTTAAPDTTTGLPDITGDASTGPDPTGKDSSTGMDACPGPQRLIADFSVTPDEEIAANCTVLAVGGDPGSTVIDLDCEGQAITLGVTTPPDLWSPYVAEGQLVHLDYIVDPIFWINRWVALRTADGETDWLLVGGVSGSALDPPGTTLDALFGGSLGAPTVTEVSGLCEPYDDGCGMAERLALDFTIPDGGPVRVYDGGWDLADVLAYGYGFIVQEAIHHNEPILCDDLPPAWFQLMVLYFPSD